MGHLSDDAEIFQRFISALLGMSEISRDTGSRQSKKRTRKMARVRSGVVSSEHQGRGGADTHGTPPARQSRAFRIFSILVVARERACRYRVQEAVTYTVALLLLHPDLRLDVGLPPNGRPRCCH
jgi:hypothetical protein